MKFKTSITNIENGEESIRGYKLEALIRDHSFVESIYLLLKGELPSEKQTKMFDAMLTSVIDHGPGVASTMNARISASARNPLHTSVAAGLLGLGERHGTVIEQAMHFFYTHKNEPDVVQLLKDMKARKEFVMGYGHKIFKEKDPRAVHLLELARELDFFGEHCAFAFEIETGLKEISSAALPLNADGAIAAILCDMGFDERMGNGIFVIARVPGLVAHIVEERTNDEGIRRIPQEDIEYV